MTQHLMQGEDSEMGADRECLALCRGDDSGELNQPASSTGGIEPIMKQRSLPESREQARMVQHLTQSPGRFTTERVTAA